MSYYEYQAPRGCTHGLPVRYADWNGRPPPHLRSAVDDPQQVEARRSRVPVSDV